MPTFHYKAVTSDGDFVVGAMEAPSREAALAAIRTSGQLPVYTSERPEKHGWLRALSPTASRRAPLGSAGVTMLTNELAMLLASGMPVDASLRTLERVTENEALRGSVGRLLGDVQQGRGLAQAFANQPAVFSAFFVAVARSGEAAGDMAAALRRLARALEARDALRASVVGSLTYPALLTLVATLSIVFLLIGVVPQFVPLFADVGNVLPLPTRMLFAMSSAARGYWWLLLPALMLAAAAASVALRNDERRRSLAAAALRVPAARRLIRAFETAQFTRTAETLLTSGVPLLNAMRLAASVVSNPTIRGELLGCVDGLRGGVPLAQLLGGTREVPRLAIELISVGEQTGQLPEMLGRVADIYDAQVRDHLKRLLTLLEPALIIGLGVIVGGIIASILTALLSLTDLVAL